MNEYDGDASDPSQTSHDKATRVENEVIGTSDKKDSPPERILDRIKQYQWIAWIIVIGTIIIAVGNFFDAVGKISQFWGGSTHPSPATVAELQNTIHTTVLELKGSFDALTAGRTPPIPDSEFAPIYRLIDRIDQLDPGNGHVIYYRGFIMRWRNQRLASHDILLPYLERAKDPNLHLVGDNGDANFCFDNWHGYCKQRMAYIHHVVALDFQRAAADEKNPAVALARLKSALEHAEMAIALYGEFNAPGQGTPTRTLAEELRRQISKSTQQ